MISHPGSSLVHVLPTDVPCHSEVCHFAREIFAQKNIPGRQITMNNLEIIINEIINK